MAAPNLLALTDWLSKTARLAGTNTMTDLIAAVASGHAISVNAVFAGNCHASVRGWATLVHKRGGTEMIIAKETPVPVHGTINLLLGKSLNLEEGDSLRVQANASSNVNFFAPYDDVD